MLTGSVAEFHEGRGLGTVITSEGTPYLFHVIEIADGTRTIDAGCAVVFEPFARFGRFQAAGIRKI